MAAIHVRNVDDGVIQALKARAARHHRSLQAEVLSILEQAVAENRDPEGRVRLSLRTVRVGAEATFSREEIYDDDGR